MEPLEGWSAPDEGALFVVTGPSGAGKSTLVREARASVPDLVFSVSATTRARRTGETDGRDYRFVTEAAFARLVADGAFLEHATVYGHAYGTLRGPVEEAIAAGRSVVLDIDVQGMRSIRATWPGAVTVMVLPPDLATLEGRLRRRATETADTIASRMTEAAFQLAGVAEVDYLVVNDHLPTAHAVFRGLLLAELSRRSRRGSVVRRMQEELAARR